MVSLLHIIFPLHVLSLRPFATSLSKCMNLSANICKRFCFKRIFSTILLSCDSFCWKSATAQLPNGRNPRFGPELWRKTIQNCHSSPSSCGPGSLPRAIFLQMYTPRHSFLPPWHLNSCDHKSYQQYNVLKNRIIVDNSDFIRIFAAPKNGLKHINNLFTNIYAYNSTISSQRTRGYRREEQISRVGCLSSEKRRMRTCVHNYT